MDENNIKRVWYVCAVIQDFCKKHKNCDYCPFYDSRNLYDECTFADATDFDVDELQKLFPAPPRSPASECSKARHYGFLRAKQN